MQVVDDLLKTRSAEDLLTDRLHSVCDVAGDGGVNIFSRYLLRLDQNQRLGPVLPGQRQTDEKHSDRNDGDRDDGPPFSPAHQLEIFSRGNRQLAGHLVDSSAVNRVSKEHGYTGGYIVTAERIGIAERARCGLLRACCAHEEQNIARDSFVNSAVHAKLRLAQ